MGGVNPYEKQKWLRQFNPRVRLNFVVQAAASGGVPELLKFWPSWRQLNVMARLSPLQTAFSEDALHLLHRDAILRIEPGNLLIEFLTVLVFFLNEFPNLFFFLRFQVVAPQITEVSPVVFPYATGRLEFLYIGMTLPHALGKPCHRGRRLPHGFTGMGELNRIQRLQDAMQPRRASPFPAFLAGKRVGPSFDEIQYGIRLLPHVTHIHADVRIYGVFRAEDTPQKD